MDRGDKPGNDECRANARAPVPVLRRYDCRPPVRIRPRPAIEGRSGRRRRPVVAGRRAGAELSPRPGSRSAKSASNSASAMRRSRRFARRAPPIPDDRHGASLRLMRLGAEQLGRYAAGLCAGAVRSICAAVRGGAGRRSRLSRSGAVVQGGDVGARGGQKPAFFKRAIDLGCGTGLGAAAFAKEVDRFIGIDLSPRMIERARATGLYAELEVADMVAGFARQAGRQRRSDSGRGRHGLCRRSRAGAGVKRSACSPPAACSPSRVETHGGEGVVIGEGLRYAHGAPYVRAQVEAAGLKLAHARICPRATRTMCRRRVWWWSRPKRESRRYAASQNEWHCAAKFALADPSGM